MRFVNVRLVNFQLVSSHIASYRIANDRIVISSAVAAVVNFGRTTFDWADFSKNTCVFDRRNALTVFH